MEVICIKNVSKSFKIYFDKGSTFKEKILFKNRNRHEVHEVLKEINVSINKGEAVGLIGENGCGKSTLLKLMSKIIYPDKGEIKIYGKVSSLLELGAGFHPDMTGRENIYMNASIFGLTKKEINNRIKEIVEFSELGEFIDNPVRTYSSGMYMRLAFSVAINVDAEILLIDEILAVGDTNFQSKCFEKLRDLKSKGVTIVIVTHDTGTVETFCDKAIWIKEGKVKRCDIAHKVVDAYLSYMNNKKIESIKNNIELVESENKDIKVKDKSYEEVVDTDCNHFGIKHIEITGVDIINSRGEITKVLQGGEKITIDIKYKINKELESYVFGIGFHKLDGECIMGNNTQLDNMFISKLSNTGVIRCEINELTLLTGKYILNVAIVDENHVPMDFYREYCRFNVVSSDRSIGFLSIKHNWRVLKDE